MTFVELFFDLVFVFAVTQLSHGFLEHLTPLGALQTSLLMVAVVLMPPTLVASIYGMNFKHMPELNWEYGYPFAIGLMLTAAVVPYLFFKWRKWL